MPYLVESNRFIKEVDVLRQDREFCVVKVRDDRSAVFRVRRSRIYKTKDEAGAYVSKIWKTALRPVWPGHIQLPRKKTHHDYEMDYYEEMILYGRCNH